MRTRRTLLRGALVLLLAATGVLFAVASTIERERPAPAHAEQARHGPGGEAAEADRHAEDGEGASGEAGVEILGFDTESRTATILGLAASVALGVLVWMRPARTLLVLVAAFAAFFAAGDGRELVHQLDDGRTGLAVAAAVLLVLHVVVVGLAAMMAAQRPGGAPAPPVAS